MEALCLVLFVVGVAVAAYAKGRIDEGKVRDAEAEGLTRAQQEMLDKVLPLRLINKPVEFNP